MPTQFVMPNNLVPPFILEQYQNQRYSGTFQAATLFVDLSGFTPLTETLMQHQKDGAEALANALRVIFTPLVAEVYTRGGFIPLFAGDAFTAIFRAEDEGARIDSHAAAIDAARRARSTAEAIQQWLHGNGRRVQTPYGDFDIRATAGLSFGAVQWGIVGQGELRSFYFRGQAIDGAAEAESQATDGHVVADAAFGALLKQKSDFFKKSDFLRPPEVDSTQFVTSFIPAPVLSLTAPAEFRDVCTLFLSFQTPDSVGDLHAFATEVIRLVARFRGMVNQLDFGDMGSYLLILFGAPISHENDIERAAQFLLALQETPTAVKWRAGIDYGTVWAGFRGGEERNEYGVAGNVVNRACHFFLRAPWGEIWASEVVYRALHGKRYTFATLGKIQFKGDQALPVYWLMHAEPDATEGSLFASLLADREEELAQLHEWILPLYLPEKDPYHISKSRDGFDKAQPNGTEVSAANRSAGVLIIQGEGGIGKSRLVKEWRQQLDSERSPLWLRVIGNANHQRAFGPFRVGLRRYIQSSTALKFGRDNHYNRQIFELGVDMLIESLAGKGDAGVALAQELDRTSSFLAALVDLHWADSLYAQVEPQLRFENTLAAIKTFVNALALVQPILLHCEDLHLFDTDSLQCIENLTHGFDALPIAILGTTRPPEQAASDGFGFEIQQTIVLSYLSYAGVKQVAQQILQGRPSHELVDFLLQKTSGNPYFVEQLALDLLEQKALSIERSVVDGITVGDRLVALKEADSARVPSTITGVLVSRLDRFDPAVKELIQTAAVLGREFEFAVLVQMLPHDSDIFDKVRQAHLARIWRPIENGERYLFDHALLRDAAYDMQLRSRLKEMHERAAAAIEAIHIGQLDAQYATLAYHTDRAGRVDQAVNWYELAAVEAKKQYANDDAIDYYTRALTLTPQDRVEPKIRFLFAKEAINDLAGYRDDQRTDLANLAALLSARAGDSVFAELALRQSNYARRMGDFPQALEKAQQAVELLENGDEPAMLANGYLAWGKILWMQGEYQPGQSQIMNALKVAKELDKQEITAQCYMDQGAIDVRQGHNSAARNAYLKAYDIYQIIGERKGAIGCLAMLGTVSNESGNYFDSLHYYEQALGHCREIGYRYGTDFVVANLGINYLHLGNYKNALLYQKQSLENSRQQGDRAGEAIVLASLALIHHQMGDDLQAYQFAQQARTMQPESGDRHSLAYTLTYLGHIHLALGNLSNARAAYEEALSIRSALQEEGLKMDLFAGLGLVALNKNQPTRAIGYVDKIMSWLAANDPTGIEFPIQVLWGCYLISNEVEQLGQQLSKPAAEILQAGYQLLDEMASKIEDKEMRQTFLHAIPFNRAIGQAWMMEESLQVGYGTPEKYKKKIDEAFLPLR